jgi:hypothetical protein
MFGSILDTLSISCSQVITALFVFVVLVFVYALRDLLVKYTLALAVENIRLLAKTKKVKREFTVKNIEPDLANSVTFGCLFVRFGEEAVIKDVGGALKKDADRKIRDIRISKPAYSSDKKELTVKIPIRVHRDLGVQFKCWVEADVADYDKLVRVARLLRQDRKTFYKIDNPAQAKKFRISDRPRLYFVVRDWREVTTPEGFTNNFIYPK